MKMNGTMISMASFQKDFVASYLRLQILDLQNVMESIENAERYDDRYIATTLNSVEKELRQIRKMYVNN